MKGYSYEKSCRKIGAYHAGHLFDLVCLGGLPNLYESDNPLRSLQVEVPVTNLDSLCRAITGTWVLSDNHLLLYGRESALLTVADVANEFGKLDGGPAWQSFRNEFGGYYSEEMEKRAAEILKQVRSDLYLMHLIAAEHPHLRDWGHGTEAEIVLLKEAQGDQYGGLLYAD